MKKFFSFFMKFIAVMSVLAAIAYWVYYFLSATGHRTCMMFKSNFTDDETPPIDAHESAAPAPSTCEHGDAVCAVDMCMPY